MILFSKGGISMFQLTSPKKQKAFTLVELLTVMVVLVALATITVKSTAQFSFDSRYQITEDRYDKIKTAILGNPNQTINGHPSVSGFVADMGRLPSCLRELIDGKCADGDTVTPFTELDEVGYCSDGTKSTKSACVSPATWITGYCLNSSGNLDNTAKTKIDCNNLTPAGTWKPYSYSKGWRGSYLETTSNPSINSAFADGWGNKAQCFDASGLRTNHSNQTACELTAGNVWYNNTNGIIDKNYGWSFVQNSPNTNDLIIKSYGKDGFFDVIITPTEEYDYDYPNNNLPAIYATDWVYPSPTLHFQITGISSSVCVTLYYRDNNILKSLATTADPSGAGFFDNSVVMDKITYGTAFVIATVINPTNGSNFVAATTSPAAPAYCNNSSISAAPIVAKIVTINPSQTVQNW
jgi:prepilin-type N-terminal cleavage/methylation domain-containing protein